MDADQVVRIHKALADPRRMEILERIAAGEEMACSEINAEFPITQATISHHLKELQTAGLIDLRKESKFHYYRFRRDVWTEYQKEMARRLGLVQ